MELAQMYFPAIAPRSAWRRMKDFHARRGLTHL